MDERVELLKKKIEEAFSNVPYPGDDHIVSHRCWECDEIKDALQGTHWKDWGNRSPQDWGILSDTLPLLTPQAYHFYFPGYLFHILEHYDKESMINSSLIWSLIPPNLQRPHTVDPQNLKKTMEQHPGLFTAEDREKVIASFRKSGTPEETQRMKEYYLERVKQFSPRQISAIKSFLRFMQERHGGDDLFGDIRLALENLPDDTNA